ncbi:MAG: DUF3556 domain-containing protein [Alphaproteobacteria bacterium]|nr:DUF3556 domain-containing protein [Alphaproteobacteria bacterium]
MIQPILPPYDLAAWRAAPFPQRVRMVCQAWAIQGYGTPLPVYLVYALKVGFYVGAWAFFCGFSAEGGWLSDDAFRKAVLWSVAFEGLGLGCGSGPLTGRYVPPFGGALWFLRPGTTKMPLLPGILVFGGIRRTWLDVALYAAHMAFLFRALAAPEVTPLLLLPTVVLLPVLGLTDKTLFLASRAEHYLSAIVCLLFVDDWIAGSKLVWVAVWMWAATSKLNPHFPAVVGVMISNSPWARFGPLRRWMYRNYPDDLRPSALARAMAHAGTATELCFPLLLLFGDGGALTLVGLAVMLGFHIFITSNVPMGVPIEWNVLMVYGAFFLFGHHAEVSALSLSAPALIAWIALAHLALPLYGNLRPDRVSFLMAMRYYAGNWAYSVWLFKEGATEKLERGLVTSGWTGPAQLRMFYDEDVTQAVLSKVLAFRHMHLHGRALHRLLPRAVDDIESYEYVDGELVAGYVLGWNFGEGHLHDLQLLRAVQAQCGLEPGELRCVFVESQPMGGRTLKWTLADAATGVFDSGDVSVAELEALQPWPSDEDGPTRAA